MKLLRYPFVALGLLAGLGLAADAQAEIGWAGMIWPNHGTTQVSSAPLTVYAQVWKIGVTDSPGPGADIAATLYFKTDLVGTDTSVPMVYNTDISLNDEYKGDVPQAALVGAAWVEIWIEVRDVADNTTYTALGDQAGNGQPIRYNITQALPNDVAVTFTLCMSGNFTAGEPCVTGSQAPIGNWGTGVGMTNVSGELWTVTVTFPAGSSPALEYKYKADGCANWEADPNRSVTLPTDGSAAVTLPADSYDRAPIGCGLGAVLSEEKLVCLQVCLTGIEAPPVCVIGNVSQLGDWTTGVAAHLVGPALYQACISFPAGTAIPVNVEYKFKKDDCSTWEEEIPNRAFTIDDGSPSHQTIMNSWNDGPSACAPVDTRHTSWGRLKSLYR